MSMKQRKQQQGSCPVCGAPSSRGACQRHRSAGAQAEHADKYASYRPPAEVIATTLTMCPETPSNRRNRTLKCSLPEGHPGLHVALVGRTPIKWANT